MRLHKRKLRSAVLVWIQWHRPHTSPPLVWVRRLMSALWRSLHKQTKRQSWPDTIVQLYGNDCLKGLNLIIKHGSAHKMHPMSSDEQCVCEYGVLSVWNVSNGITLTNIVARLRLPSSKWVGGSFAMIYIYIYSSCVFIDYFILYFHLHICWLIEVIYIWCCVYYYCVITWCLSNFSYIVGRRIAIVVDRITSFWGQNLFQMAVGHVGMGDRLSVEVLPAL
jgi:hypothetical protein